MFLNNILYKKKMLVLQKNFDSKIKNILHYLGSVLLLLPYRFDKKLLLDE